MPASPVLATLLCALFGTVAFAAPALTFETTVPAPREQVFRAWSTSAGLRAFLEVDAVVELRVGGPYEIAFGPDLPAGSRGSEGCRVLSYVPDSMLSFTWNAPPTIPALRARRTFVVVQLTDAPGDGRTHVRLTHAGWPDDHQDWPEVRGYFERAWPNVLRALKSACERGLPDLPDPLTLPGSPPPVYWSYHLTPADPTFPANASPAEQATVGAHFAHLERMAADGVLVMAGRTEASVTAPGESPDAGRTKPLDGIVVFAAPDHAAAQTRMEADPAVASGLFVAELRPFRLALIRDRVEPRR